MVNDFHVDAFAVKSSMQTELLSGRAPLERPLASLASQGRRSPRPYVAASLGLVAGSIVGLWLPPPVFRTHAVVGVGDGGSAMRIATTRAAADAVVSRPVMARAAASLIGTAMPVPEPAFAERLAVATGLTDARAAGREARLARALAAAVRAAPGDVAGTIDIFATDPDADRAAQVASTVADAFVVDGDDRAAATNRDSDMTTAARLEGLKASASAAHRRFASLGGVELDPARAQDAAARTVVAQGRVDAIRAIIASGSPPLGDRKDAPPSIESVQNAYLDLARQLAKARETLGDRHTTVIALQNGLRRAGTNLTAEWKRLLRIAEADLSGARSREASLGAGAPMDATRRAAIDEAREATQRADEAVALAEAARYETSTEDRYRLIARAPVPLAAIGFTLAPRTLIAVLAGFCVLVLVLVLPTRRRGDRAPVPMKAERELRLDQDETRPGERSFFETEMPDGEIPPQHDSERSATMIKPIQEGPDSSDADEQLRAAVQDVLPMLAAIEAQCGVPAVMVAANEFGVGTMGVALALGQSVAATGLRVLIVESVRPRPELAAAADPDSEPVLVDVFGGLRVALRAEATDGFLYLAPSFRNGTRIASALARSGDVSFVDDVAAEFDLIVIDGGRAAESAGAEPVADAFLRVGRFASQRDDERFLGAFGATKDAFIGTIAASVFVPKQIQKPKASVAPFVAAARPTATPTAPRRVASTMPSTARRKVAMR